MQDIRLAAAFLSNGGGATPVNSQRCLVERRMVTTTGNVVIDLLHNFHLECGARIHKLRVYETMTEPTGREVCGYLLVRGSVHAHAYALALKKITGVAIEKMLPTPNIDLARIPECQKYLDEGSHRRLYRFSPDDYREMAGIWSNDEVALPGDPPGELEVVDGHPEGGRIHELMGDARAFSPDYAPEEMFEIATKLYGSRGSTIDTSRRPGGMLTSIRDTDLGSFAPSAGLPQHHLDHTLFPVSAMWQLRTPRFRTATPWRSGADPSGQPRRCARDVQEIPEVDISPYLPSSGS